MQKISTILICSLRQIKFNKSPFWRHLFSPYFVKKPRRSPAISTFFALSGKKIFNPNRPLLTLVCLILMTFSLGLVAQCPPTASSFYIDFDGPAPMEPDCSVYVESEQTIYSGDVLNLTGVLAGQTYVVNMCNGTAWNAVLSVYDPDTNLVAFDDGTDSGCDLGAKLSFTASVAGTYFVTASKTDCSVDFTQNGKVQVFNNTNGAVDCPDAGGIECTLEPYFVTGPNRQLSETPHATCAKDWGEDILNSNPARVFVPVLPYKDFANQPYKVTTSHGKVYDGVDFTSGSNEVTLNTNFVCLIGLTQEDFSGEPITITITSVDNSGCEGTLTIPADFITESVDTLCPAEGEPEPPEPEACTAESGSLIAPATTNYAADGVSEAILSNGASIDPLYSFFYVLTTDSDATDDVFFNIIATSTDGIFNFGELGITEGTYNVHALSYLSEDAILINTAESADAIFAAISAGELCADLSGTEFAFTIDNNVGLISTGIVNDIKLYPIPTSSEINVDFHTEYSTAGFIKIYDLTGQALFENVIFTNAGANNYKIDLSDYKQSIYLLELTIEDETMTKRIVKR